MFLPCQFLWLCLMLKFFPSPLWIFFFNPALACIFFRFSFFDSMSAKELWWVYTYLIHKKGFNTCLSCSLEQQGNSQRPCNIVDFLMTLPEADSIFCFQSKQHFDSPHKWQMCIWKVNGIQISFNFLVTNHTLVFFSCPTLLEQNSWEIPRLYIYCNQIKMLDLKGSTFFIQKRCLLFKSVICP